MSARKVKAGRPKGICKTENYSAVLNKIADEGFQTYPELRSTVLQNVTRQHSWKLLKKLNTAGFLSECRGDGGGIRGWALSQTGQNQIRINRDDGWKSEYRYPLYKTAYDHDVTLREVKNIFLGSPSITQWTPEYIVKSNAMRAIQYLNHKEKRRKLTAIPDALFQFESADQNFKAALELEMTRKSRSRLLHKFESQVTDSNFDFIFYVVNGEPLMQVLWDTYREVLSQSLRVKMKSQPNGIYFALLENLRRDRLQALFTGKKDTFSFQ
jgi:hypothetical protein